MTQKYYAIVTNLGAAKIANAAALGTKLNITQMAVGDGSGSLPTPDASQTRLVNEVRRAAINTLSVDAANASQIIAEQVIPETEGGFWIREMGLFDADGTLIAVCNTPETYKPALQEGSGRTQTVRMILIVNSTDAITLKIDPSVVLATRKYVDDKAIEVRAYADSLMAKHLAAADPHSQYAPKVSPTFTGTPKAPTAAAGNNSMQLANTAFVQAALAALAGSAPATLDTLKELADALGNDPNFSATVLNKLAGKMDIAKNGSDIADVAAFLKNLGLGEAAKMSAAEASMTGGNGWLIIPVNISGIEREFIFQWGYASGSSTYKVNYPVVFPNNVKCFFAIPNTTLEAGISYLSMANVTPVSNSQATIIVGKVTNGNNELFTRAVHWFAVGY